MSYPPPIYPSMEPLSMLRASSSNQLFAEEAGCVYAHNRAGETTVDILSELAWRIDGNAQPRATSVCGEGLSDLCSTTPCSPLTPNTSAFNREAPEDNPIPTSHIPCEFGPVIVVPNDQPLLGEAFCDSDASSCLDHVLDGVNAFSERHLSPLPPCERTYNPFPAPYIAVISSIGSDTILPISPVLIPDELSVVLESVSPQVPPIKTAISANADDGDQISGAAASDNLDYSLEANELSAGELSANDTSSNVETRMVDDVVPISFHLPVAHSDPAESLLNHGDAVQNATSPQLHPVTSDNASSNPGKLALDSPSCTENPLSMSQSSPDAVDFTPHTKSTTEPSAFAVMPTSLALRDPLEKDPTPDESKQLLFPLSEAPTTPIGLLVVAEYVPSCASDALDILHDQAQSDPDMATAFSSEDNYMNLMHMNAHDPAGTTHPFSPSIEPSIAHDNDLHLSNDPYSCYPVVATAENMTVARVEETHIETPILPAVPLNVETAMDICLSPPQIPTPMDIFSDLEDHLKTDDSEDGKIKDSLSNALDPMVEDMPDTYEVEENVLPLSQELSSSPIPSSSPASLFLSSPRNWDGQLTPPSSSPIPGCHDTSALFGEEFDEDEMAKIMSDADVHSDLDPFNIKGESDHNITSQSGPDPSSELVEDSTQIHDENFELKKPKSETALLSPPKPPNPKRLTHASQRKQYKKLVSAFRSPLVTNTIPSLHKEIVLRKPQISLTDVSPVASNFNEKTNGAGTRTTSRDYTASAAKQFKSPFRMPLPGRVAATQGAIPATTVSNIHSAPTMQSLMAQVQKLKHAIKLSKDACGQEDKLEELLKKWTHVGREVAWQVWDTVKDSEPGYPSEVKREWDGEVVRVIGRKRAFEDDCDNQDTKRVKYDSYVEGSGRGDRRMEVDQGHQGHQAEQMECPTMSHSLGTMLRFMGIAPETLGWDDMESDFVDELE